MMRRNKQNSVVIVWAALLFLCIGPFSAAADTAAEIDKDVDIALKKLYSSVPAAGELSKVAEAILVFPDILKGGFIIGAQYGVGALRDRGGKTQGYYRTTAASYGLQAGAQTFGYAMFLMTKESLEYLQESAGWEIGVGPNVVIVDEGAAKSLTTTTAKDDIYAFIFDQEGLMAGLGIQGSKITEFTPEK